MEFAKRNFEQYLNQERGLRSVTTNTRDDALVAEVAAVNQVPRIALVGSSNRVIFVSWPKWLGQARTDVGTKWPFHGFLLNRTPVRNPLDNEL